MVRRLWTCEELVVVHCGSLKKILGYLVPKVGISNESWYSSHTSHTSGMNDLEKNCLFDMVIHDRTPVNKSGSRGSGARRLDE